MAVWFSIGLLSVVLNLPHCLSSAKQDHHITSVNSENVNDHLSGSGGENNKFSLVLFYAPWQKECERNVELMESLAINFRNRSDVFIGIADIYNDRKLASKFHIEDYCLVKYFVKGSSVAERYDNWFVFLHTNHSTIPDLSQIDFFFSIIFERNFIQENKL